MTRYFWTKSKKTKLSHTKTRVKQKTLSPYFDDFHLLLYKNIIKLLAISKLMPIFVQNIENH